MTFTLAVLPLAIVGVPLGNYAPVLVVMGFVASMPVWFTVLTLARAGDEMQALRLPDVLTFGAAVVFYLAAAALVLITRSG